MTFAHPWFLLLLLLLPLLAWLQGRHGRPPAFLYSSVQLVRAVLNVTRSRSGGFLAALRWLTLATCIVALARPQLTQSETQIRASGIDIVVALDMSRSMISEDFEVRRQRVNRFEMARTVLKEFIDKRPNDRIGLVVFASEAYIAAPPTLDHDFLVKNLDRLQLCSIAPNQTAIGSGLASAVNRLRDLKSKSKIVILMTDGQNNAGNVAPLTVAEAAKVSSMKVYTIGVGIRGNAPMPATDENCNFIRDMFGRKQYQQVPVDIDEETLQKIAKLTGGQYYRADNAQKFQDIYDEIDKLEKSEAEIKKYSNIRELYGWLVAPGVGLLLLEVLLRHTVLRRLP